MISHAINSNKRSLSVTIGILKNSHGEILISKRANASHQGGLWEFPGGKIAQHETGFAALTRELSEELGVILNVATPLINIRHTYQDLAVALQVWQVDDFSGTVVAKEGQPLKWTSVQQLAEYNFPAANKTLITALQLPNCYAILDDSDKMALIPKLKKIVAQPIKLIQARLKHSTSTAIKAFLNEAMPLCQQYQAQLLLNSQAINTLKFNPAGVHLTCADLMRLDKRPVTNGWLAASCHNLVELQQAEKIGVDFAVLSPVLPTPTHSNAALLGWKKMSTLIDAVNIPVFALGGLTLNDLQQARLAGAQGIAGIRSFLG
jgi:8-oxo-dGTP diphosphatase